MTVLVVVTGPPASGKTTIARGLAKQLGVPYLSKDAFKERLYDVYGNDDEELAERASFSILLGVAADQLDAGIDVVVESNFDAESDVGPLLQLLDRGDRRLVQVHCGGDAAELADAFAERAASGERHPGHGDRPSDRDEVFAKIEAGYWDPLDLPGPLVRVTGGAPDDMKQLADEVETVR